MLFAAPPVGIERWHVIAAALPARGGLAVTFAAALVVVLGHLVTRRWRPRFGVPLVAALALAARLHLPVVISRKVIGERRR